MRYCPYCKKEVSTRLTNGQIFCAFMLFSIGIIPGILYIIFNQRKCSFCYCRTYRIYIDRNKEIQEMMNSSDKHLKYVGCRLDIQHKIKELKEPLQYKHMSHKKYKELKKHYKDELIHLTKDYYKNHPSYC